jgi:MarR family 2-MHQ and catechol resistance regulon transcriptional repressor
MAAPLPRRGSRPRAAEPSAADAMIAPAMTLVPEDPLAHRALEWLLHAESSVRRRLAAELERAGLSTSGFSVLVVLTTAGGELELRTLRRRLRTSKANATEVVTTLEQRGLVSRRRLVHDRRTAVVALTERGRALTDRLFPEHTRRVEQAFAVLDESEKRFLAEICRKLAA